MTLDHDPELGLRLLEAHEFRRFKIRLHGGERRPSLEGVQFVDDDNALVDVALAPRLPGAPDTQEWRDGYQAMIAYAASKGWIDPASSAIRAHVERIC